MSEVTKKSDTSSSQMRLLGGTPHMFGPSLFRDRQEEGAKEKLFVSEGWLHNLHCHHRVLYLLQRRLWFQGELNAALIILEMIPTDGSSWTWTRAPSPWWWRSTTTSTPASSPPSLWPPPRPWSRGSSSRSSIFLSNCRVIVNSVQTAALLMTNWVCDYLVFDQTQNQNKVFKLQISIKL